jgi:hypothetical protein
MRPRPPLPFTVPPPRSSDPFAPPPKFGTFRLDPSDSDTDLPSDPRRHRPPKSTRFSPNSVSFSSRSSLPSSHPILLTEPPEPDEDLPEVRQTDEVGSAIDCVVGVLNRPLRSLSRSLGSGGFIDDFDGEPISAENLQAFAEFLDRLREEARIACDSAKAEVRAAAAAGVKRGRGGQIRSIVARAIAEFQAEKDARTRRLIGTTEEGIPQKLERVKEVCQEVEKAVEETRNGGNTTGLVKPLREGCKAFADLENAVDV